MTPTLANVARLAGVSPATASRVFTGSARVSQTTRIQVENAVEQLGYLRRRTHLREAGSPKPIVAVLCEESARVFTDPFFARLLSGIKRELSGSAPLAIVMVGTPSDWKVTADYLRDERAAGILLISLHRDHPAALISAVSSAPMVLAGRPLTDVPLPYVDVDNRGGAHAATRHLLDSGRRMIATIAGPADMSVGVDRLAGFRCAAEEGDMDVTGLIGHGDFSQMSGETMMTRLLNTRPNLDAVVAASDLMAVGAIRALRRAGRRVPDDVAVVGFDDAPIARQVRPRLTTVRQPIELLGARLVRELSSHVKGRPPSDRGVVLGTKLIVRDSA